MPVKKSKGKAERIKKREMIVDHHTSLLLNALREEGFKPLGLAGGIVLDEGKKSRCHTYFSLAPNVLRNGRLVNPETFVEDVVLYLRKSNPGKGLKPHVDVGILKDKGS